jgi:hypothetical protein
MSFRDFTYPEVQQQLQLTPMEVDLFATVPPLELRSEFIETIRDGTELALAIDTEKARSEFIIAPVLWELRRCFRGRFGLFSGVALDVDPGRGLSGYCDFLLTRSPQQMVPRAPLMAVVEAKNDNPRSGLGHCIAAMVAVQEFNQRAGDQLLAVYGTVTTGGAWRFLRLEGTQLEIDLPEYFISDVGKIMGIFAHVIQHA